MITILNKTDKETGKTDQIQFHLDQRTKTVNIYSSLWLGMKTNPKTGKITTWHKLKNLTIQDSKIIFNNCIKFNNFKTKQNQIF